MSDEAEPPRPDALGAAAASPQITLLLQCAASGDRTALDAVYASLYPDLKRIARSRLRVQGRGDSVSTTMLVHESFVRLVGARDLRIEDRRQHHGREPIPHHLNVAHADHPSADATNAK